MTEASGEGFDQGNGRDVMGTERPAMAASAPKCGLALAGLLVFAALTCMGGLGHGPMMGDHECIVAQSARQAIQTGEWIIPRVGEIQRIRKTPLGIWLVAATSKVLATSDSLPVTSVSARLPSAMAGFLTALTVLWLGSMMFGRDIGVVAGFISAGCLGTILYSRNAQVDMVLTLFTALSFACFWRGALCERPARWAMAAFYVAFGLAMMAKFPLPLATVGLSLFVYWFVTAPWLMRREAGTDDTAAGLPSLVVQQLRRVTSLWLIPGLIVFAVVAGSWLVYAWLQVPNAAKLWKMEYMERFTGDMSERRQPLYYYVPIVFGLTTPFLLSLPEAVAALFLSRYREQRKGLAYAFTWAIVGTAFISASAYKRPHYVLSMLPAYCLLLAPVIYRLFFGQLIADAKLIRRCCVAVPVGLMATAMVAGALVRREIPELMTVFLAIAVLVLVVWTAAAIAFARNRRMLSFLLLQAGTLCVLLAGWPAAGKYLKLDPEAHALAAALREHHIKAGDEIYLVGGRPNSAIEFYSGLRLRRLINELEMADLRENRREVGDDVMREMQKRMEKLLQREGTPVYLVLESGHYGMFQRYSKVRARPILELSGFEEQPGAEWMVITQTWNTGS